MNKRSTIVIGVAGVIGWFVIFGLGLFIASKPYRDELLKTFEFKAFLVSLLTYTPTNIAALCVLAALVGGCASRLVLSEAESALAAKISDPKVPVSDTHIYMRESPASSLLRGFVVYVAFLAGVYITSTAPFADPTQEQYARASGTISLLAFVVGYDPTLFQTFISLGAKLKRE